MIKLYTASTFNGKRVSIMLEEIGFEYSVRRVDLAKGEQRQSDFLKLNPSGKIPVLVDEDTQYQKPVVVTQSIAILQYLAEKSDKLLPKSLGARAKVYEWMQFHAVDIGSTIFAAFYLQNRCVPSRIDAADDLRKRVNELYGYFDQQLESNEFLAGDHYSIADITALPAVITQEQQLIKYPHLSRWLLQLKQRQAVQRGLAVPVEGQDEK